MNTIKQYCLLLTAILLISSCDQLEYADDRNNFTPKYPDMPVLEHPAVALAGEYEGMAAMGMDPSKPLLDFPGTFTVSPVSNGQVTLSASIKPGRMPFPVNYMLDTPSSLHYSSLGYAVSGSFKIDVTLGDGTKQDMPKFYFTLNDRSRFFMDSNGQYWLELYYPDQKMASGKILPGDCFFKGKKKQ